MIDDQAEPIYILPTSWPEPGPPPSELRETDNLSYLRDFLRSFSLTPFLGAECSAIGRTASTDWELIGVAMKRVLASFTRGEQRQRQYLESLARANDVPINSSKPLDPKKELNDLGVLDNLRRRLVECGSLAVSSIGKRMALEPRAVGATGTHAFAITDQNDCGALREALLSAAAEALLLVHKGKQQPRAQEFDHFEADHVFNRLIDLTKKVADGYLSQTTVANVRGEFEGATVDDVLAALKITSEDKNPEPPAEVYIDQFEWIANLLWYTFRVHCHMYPTNAELAFQVSLRIEHADRMPDLLVNATDTLGPNDPELLRRLQGWFHRYRAIAPEDNRVMADFYSAIASYLSAQYSHYLPKARMRGAPRQHAIAFSTNLDMELEDAFEREGLFPYHVVVPIGAKTPGEPPIVHLRWLLGTISNASEQQAPDWSWFPLTGDVSLPPQVAGPVLIKLHGSPLHKLPEDAEAFGTGLSGYAEHEDLQYADFEHALTYSESQILQTVVWRSLPRFLNAVFGDKWRMFAFIGQSVDEWNVRLRIFERAYAGNLPNPPGFVPRMMAISSSLDAYRSSSLRYLGMRRLRGPLELLTPAIRATLGIKAPLVIG